MKPRCWKCQSFNVHVRFTGYTPTFHAAGECDCPRMRESCGESLRRVHVLQLRAGLGRATSANSSSS
jgi:hypothetical protein